MQVLLVSDLHYNLRHFDWLLEVAPEYGVVVLAGDHLDVSSSVALDSQWLVVLRYLERLAARTTVAASSGNHDLTSRNAYGEKVAGWLAAGGDLGAVVDGDSVQRGDVRITVCPWWDGGRTRDDVGAQLRADAVDRPRTWIWVYHPPPDGSPTAQGRRRSYGDVELRNWIDELAPDVVLTGHVHEAPYVASGSWHARSGRTWIFNSGRVPSGRMPNHVSLDFDAGRAFWWGNGDSAEVELDP